MSRFRHIIFDLGGVIINLDIPATIHAFKALGASDFESIYTQLAQHDLFDGFDKGTISEQDFYRAFCDLTKLHIDFKTFETAWNAMLLDFPTHRLQLLQQLKPNYATFLLSNTNETHVRAFESILQKEHGVSNLENYFQKVYYSCRMGMRKPDTEIFNHLLETQQLNPNETLFIDDSPQHIEGAKRCGIHAFQLLPGKELHELLKDLGIK